MPDSLINIQKYTGLLQLAGADYGLSPGFCLMDKREIFYHIYVILGSAFKKNGNFGKICPALNNLIITAFKNAEIRLYSCRKRTCRVIRCL